MIEDVKILTSPNKADVERFIMEYSDKGYYRNDFKTNTIYDSFQFSGAYKVYYTVVMVKYKDEPIQNSPVTTGISTITSTEEPIEYTGFTALLNNNKEQDEEQDGDKGLSSTTESESKDEGDKEVLGKGDSGNGTKKKTS